MATDSAWARARSSRIGGAKFIRRVIGRPVAIAGLIIIALAWIHPAHGTGYTICMTQLTTHLPCPGCGMTRSVSCAVRGDVASSVSYHPFGIVLLAVLASAIVVHALPPRLRRRLWRLALRHVTIIRRGYLSAVAIFIAFGLLRLIVIGAG